MNTIKGVISEVTGFIRDKFWKKKREKMERGRNSQTEEKWESLAWKGPPRIYQFKKTHFVHLQWKSQDSKDKEKSWKLPERKQSSLQRSKKQFGISGNTGYTKTMKQHIYSSERK